MLSLLYFNLYPLKIKYQYTKGILLQTAFNMGQLCGLENLQLNVFPLYNKMKWISLS